LIALLGFWASVMLADPNKISAKAANECFTEDGTQD
jgi:hypothetical protein